MENPCSNSGGGAPPWGARVLGGGWVLRAAVRRACFLSIVFAFAVACFSRRVRRARGLRGCAADAGHGAAGANLRPPNPARRRRDRRGEGRAVYAGYAPTPRRARPPRPDRARRSCFFESARGGVASATPGWGGRRPPRGGFGGGAPHRSQPHLRRAPPYMPPEPRRRASAAPRALFSGARGN